MAPVEVWYAAEELISDSDNDHETDSENDSEIDNGTDNGVYDNVPQELQDDDLLYGPELASYSEAEAEQREINEELEQTYWYISHLYVPVAFVIQLMLSGDWTHLSFSDLTVSFEQLCSLAVPDCDMLMLHALWSKGDMKTVLQWWCDPIGESKRKWQSEIADNVRTKYCNLMQICHEMKLHLEDYKAPTESTPIQFTPNYLLKHGFSMKIFPIDTLYSMRKITLQKHPRPAASDVFDCYHRIDECILMLEFWIVFQVSTQPLSEHGLILPSEQLNLLRPLGYSLPIATALLKMTNLFDYSNSDLQSVNGRRFSSVNLVSKLSEFRTELRQKCSAHCFDALVDVELARRGLKRLCDCRRTVWSWLDEKYEFDLENIATDAWNYTADDREMDECMYRRSNSD